MNPWLILGVVVAWLASLAAVGSWQHDAGVTSERVKNQAKENAQLVAANKEVERLRKVEQAGAAQIITIGDAHAKRIATLEARRARDVADARSGALKLRIPGACNPPARAGEVPATAPTSDAAPGIELPPETTRRLFELADDADRNTDELTACQAIVTSYLTTQEGATP